MEKRNLNSDNYQQSFQEVLMGQAFKGFSTKSKSGRLG